MTDPTPRLSPSPLRIALVYAALAGLWIVFSDQAFEWLFGIPAQITLANMLKGGSFVIATALSLYVLLRYRSANPVGAAPLTGRHNLLPTLTLLATVITALTVGVILKTLEHRQDVDIGSTIAWIALTGVLTLFATASALLLSRQRQQTLIAQEIAQSQNERLRALHLLAAIADSSSEAIFAKDMDNRFILFNRAAEDLTGKTQAEVLGLDESVLVPPEVAQRQMADNRKVMDDNISLNIQEEIAFLGDKRTFLTTKGPLHDSEGQVIGLYGISRDITERTKMETALREREASFRMLTEQIPAIIYRANLDELSQTIYISPRVQELGYTPEEWLAQPDIWVQSLHPEDRPRVLAELEAFQAKGGVLSLEYRLRTRVGEWRYFQDEAEILHNEVGQRLYLQGIMLDVTARHEIEVELDSVHTHANMLVDLLNHSSQAFGQGFSDGSLGFHNPAFLDLVGYTEEELTNINWVTDLTPPEWLEKEQEKLAELHRTGKSVTYEKEYLRKDGSRVPIELLVHLIRDEAGLPKYYYAFITDISERKQTQAALLRQTEELRRHNEELERFNRATVGRELDMIRLKQQINEMALRLGDAPPYSLDFLDQPEKESIS
jgi:PAS domain S-box-containing protein